MYQGPDISTGNMEQSILYVDGGDESLLLANNDAQNLEQMGLNAEINGTTNQYVESGLASISDTTPTNATNQQIPGDFMELVTRFNFNKTKLPQLPKKQIQKISEAGLIRQDDENLQCQYCSIKIPFQELSVRNHPFVEHGKKAPWCIHVKNHPQETMQSHMDSCPQRQFECPFKSTGCTFRGQDEAVKIHQMDHVEQFQELNSENKKLKQEIASLKHQVEELKFAGRGDMSSKSMGPPEQQGANITKIKHQDHSDFKKRYKTFESWPLSSMQSPDNLAKAGFFYTGAGDATKCFACGIVLGKWKPSDDPWTEHMKWSPYCWFIQKIKETGFVDKSLDFYSKTLKTKENVEEVKFRPKYEDQSLPDSISQQAMENLVLEERGTTGACATQELTSYASGLDEDGYKTLQDMGFSKDAVDAVIQDTTIKPDHRTLSLEEIVNQLLQM